MTVHTPSSDTQLHKPEIIDLLSSSPPPPSPPKFSAKVAAKTSQQSASNAAIIFQDPQAASSQDAEGNFYASPYSTIEPSILNYDAAKAPKGTSKLPTAQTLAVSKYTSVIEHELAITNTKMAQVHDRALELEKENSRLRRELDDLRRMPPNPIRPAPVLLPGSLPVAGMAPLTHVPMLPRNSSQTRSIPWKHYQAFGPPETSQRSLQLAPQPIERPQSQSVILQAKDTTVQRGIDQRARVPYEPLQQSMPPTQISNESIDTPVSMQHNTRKRTSSGR